MLSEKEFYLKVKEEVISNMSEMFQENYEPKLEEREIGNLNLICLTVDSHDPATMDLEMPTVVLKPVYEKIYQKKFKCNFNKTIKNIALNYEKAIREAPVKSKEQAEPMVENEFSLDSVFYTVVNYESNKERLKEIAHDQVGDLAKVYRLKSGENQNILINHEVMGKMDATMDEIREAADKNTPELFPAEITEMRNNQYYISNDKNTYGASTILYKNGPIQKLAEKLDKNILIIPATKHGVVAEGVTEKDMNKLLINMYNKGMDANKKIAESVILYDKDAKEFVFDKEKMIKPEFDRAHVKVR